VVNYEEGSEYSYAFGDDRQENLGEWGVKQFPPGVRNLANESFFEYGSRVGFWRLLDLFERHEVPATFGVCAVALERNPAAARAIVGGGHEVNAHGYRWEEHFAMERDEERERIRLAVESIRQTTGERPYGWYCRTAPSVNTRELLVEEGGFVYDSDAYNDDVPYFVEVDGSSTWWCPTPATSTTRTSGRRTVTRPTSSPTSRTASTSCTRRAGASRG
jgi:peptidoglycan/xylan/chitin deacetylase (PgdA/CDA1 family)